jgi:hypothetical protein
MTEIIIISTTTVEIAIIRYSIRFDLEGKELIFSANEIDYFYRSKTV